MRDSNLIRWRLSTNTSDARFTYPHLSNAWNGGLDGVGEVGDGKRLAGRVGGKTAVLIFKN